MLLIYPRAPFQRPVCQTLRKPSTLVNEESQYRNLQNLVLSNDDTLELSGHRRIIPKPAPQLLDSGLLGWLGLTVLLQPHSG